MKAIDKIQNLFDEATFLRTNAYMATLNKENVVLGDNVITGYGLIMGRPVYAAFVDSSVFYGAMGAVSAIKITETVNSAVNAGAPFILFNESAGLRLEEGLNGLEGYGKVIKALSDASGIIPLIGMVSGKVSGADSYLTGMCDFIFMADKSELSITSGEVLNAVNGLDQTAKITDAKSNYEISGNSHFYEETEEKCIEKIKKLLFFLPDNSDDGVPAYVCNDDLARYSDKLNEATADDKTKVTDIIREIADNNDYLEVGKGFAPCAVTAFALFNGKTVGIAANDISVNGGRINAAACRKINDFVSFCDGFNIPILTLTDTAGFDADLDGEKHGFVKEASKMADAIAFASVPKVDLVLHNAFGGAFVLMNSKTLGADIVYAWKDSIIAAANPDTAAVVLYGDKIRSAGDPIKEREVLAEEYRKNQGNAINAAAYGYVDDLIDPGETRARIISAFEILENKTSRR